ncbi:MAG: hypothetical protein F6J97_10985 [Leptolyngbya sp. SIO4C1]|nr:hypothetical protein [Leptolyngbya sp. SIO4C1]
MLQGYLKSIVNPNKAQTALKVAAIVGTALFAINHGPALVRGKMDKSRWVSAVLTYAVPYLVSIHGQYMNEVKQKE